MRGGKNAAYIDSEYKKRKIYGNKKRQNCLNKKCEECIYKNICEDKKE